jgi:hypothetical protein
MKYYLNLNVFSNVYMFIYVFKRINKNNEKDEKDETDKNNNESFLYDTIENLNEIKDEYEKREIQYRPSVSFISQLIDCINNVNNINNTQLMKLYLSTMKCNEIEILKRINIYFENFSLCLKENDYDESLDYIYEKANNQINIFETYISMRRMKKKMEILIDDIMENDDKIIIDTDEDEEDVETEEEENNNETEQENNENNEIIEMTEQDVIKSIDYTDSIFVFVVIPTVFYYFIHKFMFI